MNISTPVTRLDQLARVVVVGTSCSGKTTLARTLSDSLRVPHTELDVFYWGPNWTPIPSDQFRTAVDAATAEPYWVCDGNYSPVRDLVWKRASAVVWLNYSFVAVFSRALQRTCDRCIRRLPIFAGNRESFARAFFGRDSILLWVLQTHWRHQREYPVLLANPQHAHLHTVELRSDANTREFLSQVAQAARAQNAAGQALQGLK